MWEHHAETGWWIVFGGIWMVVFWGLIIAFAVWGVKKLARGGDSRSGPTGERDPLEIAKERYARGEISKEDFQEIRRNLS